jgi:RNase P/RNase MRP subunit p29
LEFVNYSCPDGSKARIGEVTMFDKSRLVPGERVRVAYKVPNPATGVRGTIVSVGDEAVVIRSDKSGREVEVPYENVDQVFAVLSEGLPTEDLYKGGMVGNRFTINAKRITIEKAGYGFRTNVT